MLGAGADDLILRRRAYLRRPRDGGRDRRRAPTYPLFRSPPGSSGADRRRRSGAHLSAAGRTIRPARSSRCPRRARSSSTRRTSSIATAETAVGPDRRGRRRRAYVLEGVRARRGARRLRARRARHRRGAERTPGARARLDAVRCARARRARVAAGRPGPTIEERERLATELRALGFEPLRRGRASSSCPVDDPAQLGRPAARPRLRRARVSPTRSGSPSATARTTTSCSLRSPASRARRTRARVRHLRATAETRVARAARARRRRAASASRPAPGSTTTSSSSSPSTPGSTSSLEGTGDLETGRPPHGGGHRDRARRGARPALGDRRGIARYGDAVVPMDDALARAAVDLGGPSGAELGSSPTRASPRTCSQSLAGRARSRSTSRRPARDAHHVAEAAFKAVGRALRAGGRDRGERGVPSTKGVAVNGRRLRLRRGQRPLGRARVRAARRRASRSTDADAVRAPTSPCFPASARRARPWPGCAERGLDDALRERPLAAADRSASASGCSSRSTRPRRTAASPGSGSSPAARCRLREGRVPRIGWAPVEPGGEAFYFAHSYAAETPRATAVVGGHRRRRRARARSSACSSTRRRAAPPAPGSWSDASPAPDPVPRRRGRPRREGRELPGAARRRRPGRARRGATRTRAPTSSCSST